MSWSGFHSGNLQEDCFLSKVAAAVAGRKWKEDGFLSKVAAAVAGRKWKEDGFLSKVTATFHWAF